MSEHTGKVFEGSGSSPKEAVKDAVHGACLAIYGLERFGVVEFEIVRAWGVGNWWGTDTPAMRYRAEIRVISTRD